MRTILIVSSTEDPCTDMVAAKLKERGARFMRFDTDLFQREIRMTLNMASSGEFHGTLHFPDKDLPFSDIGLVWYRRVADPAVDASLTQDLSEWASEESEWSLFTALTMISARFVNPFIPYDRISENKWIQMKAATEFGFRVPASSLTNSLESIASFWHATKQQMVFKKVRRGLVQMADGRRLLLHTSRIPRDRWTSDTLERMRFYPMFLQEDIPKRYDIRSVVVGNRVFSFAIHSQNVDIARTDYRSAFVFGRDLFHEQIELGTAVDSKLIGFVKAFGHEFGVIDLVMTPEGELIFLEDNPNGQWAWLETRTGAPIAEATAEHLTSLAQ